MYASIWEKYASGDPYLQDVIKCHVNRSDFQRAASLVATFITWLGTNVGRVALLHQANRLFSVFQHLPHAYVAAFAVANATNHPMQIELVEYIMRTPEDYETNRHAVLDLQDYRILESAAAWLGTTRGQQFIDLAECEILQRTRLSELAGISAGTTTSSANNATTIIGDFTVESWFHLPNDTALQSICGTVSSNDNNRG